jgi:DNA-binding NarL/FixJ family response regulator
MSSAVRVLIADDQKVVRDGLAMMLGLLDGIEVVGTAVDGADAVRQALAAEPDVVLMDLSMPGMDGIAATRALLDEAPTTQVVVLTSFSDRDRILGALSAGAIGYLLKDSEPAELLHGIRAAARGESPLAPRAASHIVRGLVQPPVEAQLSDREREILALIGQGTPNKVIARRLDIAEKTVKNHISSIFQTIGVTDRTQAALWASEHGITARRES